MEAFEETLEPDTVRTPHTARVIPPNEHPITLEMIDPDAMFTLRKLNKAGFSAYLVGGGVRDLYLGKSPKDYDISTEARPGQIRKLFPNSNTIGRRFRLVQVFFKKGKVIEVSTLRSLSEHDLDGPEAVLAPNNTYGTLDEDAQRRDLTINSLFYEIENQTIIDYVDGVRDLDDTIIRIIGDPEKRINRDPVRMLRAIRHAARAGFAIEEYTWQAICANHHKLRLCPPSRLRDETLKDVYGGSAAAWYALALESGIFAELFQIYENALYSPVPGKQSCSQWLAEIFTVIDRINTLAVDNQVSRQPDYFLLGLLLIPWAESRYNLYSQSFKGSVLYHLSKRLRAEIDSDLGVSLNLRRSLRQDITTLLTSLSLLIQHRQEDGSWPKWLRKKSYFKRSSLFYHCYSETIGGEPVPEDLLLDTHTSHNSQHQRKSKNGSEKGNKPAFAKRSKRGVFGLKK